MRADDLIKALGGPTAVAAALNLRVTQVGNWTLRGIPREQHLAVWRLATNKGVDWTPPDAAGLVLAPAAAPSPDPASKRTKHPSQVAAS